MMLALFFHKNNYLGLYQATLDQDNYKLSTLGGYKLDDVILPTNNSNLRISTRSSLDIKGRIGTFGIIKGKKLNKNIKEILNNHLSNPEKVPELENGEVVFWTNDGVTDISSRHYKIN